MNDEQKSHISLNTVIQTCGNWEEADDGGTDATPLVPWDVPLPGLGRCPGFAEAVVAEALDPECLLMGMVLIRLVLVVLMLGVFWPLVGV